MKKAKPFPEVFDDWLVLVLISDTTKQMNEMPFQTVKNPDELIEEEIHNMVKFCPVCGTPWNQGKHTCANPECGVKLRIASNSLNWWLFYPACNGWAVLKD